DDAATVLASRKLLHVRLTATHPARRSSSELAPGRIHPAIGCNMLEPILAVGRDFLLSFPIAPQGLGERMIDLRKRCVLGVLDRAARRGQRFLDLTRAVPIPAPVKQFPGPLWGRGV